MAKSRNTSGLLPHRKTLLIAGFATLAGLFIPYLRLVLLPVLYLNTHLHEFSHAIVAKATGAEVMKIIVNTDGSGETPVLGGNLLLIASAGYLGASVFGAMMIAFGSVEKTARWMLMILSMILMVSMALWVRGDQVGVLACLCWIILLIAMGMFLKGKAAMFACQFLGLQQCLNSFTSLAALLQITAATEAHSDASILQELSGVPAIFWAALWSMMSLALVVWTIRKTWEPVPIKG